MSDAANAAPAASEAAPIRVDETQPAIDGERKQVTVLFADVKGSMDMSEQVDADEWRQIMRRFFSLLSDGVRRFEGTVDKFTGDGIMALFGAPIAHEDHAARACFAALKMEELVSEYATELRRARGLNFSVRIGINSGEVVAGAIGADSKLEYTAVGHTVGLAQRMEALAEPGKAYLTERTAKLAEGYLELKDLGEFEVKGASRPIGVFELVGAGSARSRFDLSRERGLSRFVGRADEMQLLEDALEQAKQGRGSVIGVVAEPGVGKSRLCQEFADRCRAQGLEVYETQAQAHGTAIPFLPVLQMMRGYFGIEDRDSERVAREKVAGRLLLLDPDFSDDLPLVFDFLGVPDPERPAPQVSAEARQRLLRGVVRKLYRVPGRDDVVVNVMEDLHWMDEGSAQIIAEVVSAVEGTATLAIVNFRPEYQPEWADSPIYRRLPLVPLGPDSTKELLADLAGEDPSLDGLPDLVHERTGGNPFFIEEVIRELVEAGYLVGERGAYQLTRPVDDTGVPATVQAILAARIDRLETAKALLQAASVIGKEVPEPALKIVAGVDDAALAEGLKELIAAGFLYEAEIYPERILAFSHPLTQEVAYGSQLGEQRSKAHAAAARALIELNPPERHDELAALIAQHLENGRQTLDSARWYARAAHRAGYGHPQEAMRMWAKVSQLADELPEDEETAALGVFSRLLRLDYAWRLGMEKERVDELLKETEDRATKLGDLRSLSLLRMLARARPGLEQHGEDWMGAVDEAVALADESGDRDLRIGIRAAGSYAYLASGEYDGSERLLDEALQLAGEDYTAGAGVVIGNPYGFALHFKGVIARERGEFDRAEELLDTGLRIAAEHGDPETESWTRGQKAILASVRGEPDALAQAERNFELTERLGDVFSRTWALVYVAFVRLEIDDPAGALEAIERAESLYREAMGSGGEAEAWRAALRADALVGVGKTQEGLEEAERAATIARDRGMRWSLPRTLRSLARARAAAGQAEAASQALDEGAEAARQVGSLVELGEIEKARESLRAGSL